MVNVLAEAMGFLGASVRDLEPGELSGPDAAGLMEIYARGERLCAIGKAMCAKRATEASMHTAEGHRSRASWMASRTGDSLGAATTALSAADAADQLAHLNQALRAGELSTERAEHVGGAATADPAAEAELVEMAKEASMKRLRERAARLRAASGSAESESARYDAIRKGRYLRNWTDAEGALRLEARLCPDDGARVVASIAAVADRIFCSARRSGRYESPCAFAADALVAAVTGSGGGSEEFRGRSAAITRQASIKGETVPPAGPGIPSGTLPTQSPPSGTLPTQSLPSGTLPTPSLRTQSLPSGTLPTQSLPSGTLPTPSLRTQSLPSGTLPTQSLPTQSLPSGTLPTQSLPTQSLPTQSLPTAGNSHSSAPAGMPASAPSGSIPPARVSVRVDAAALRRGFVEGEERCEIPGVGPVPVATARSLLGDAWLRLLITDGVEVATICTLGRTVPNSLRAALEERDPTCVVPGCEVAHGLEIDHWRLDYADGGPTCAFNLARLCHHHHHLRTYRGFKLDGGPGNWRWVSPRQSPSAAGPPSAGGQPAPAPPGRRDRQPSLFDSVG